MRPQPRFEITYEMAREIIELWDASEYTTVDTEVLCTYYQVVPKTIQRWVESGRLPKPIKMGRKNEWLLDDIRRARYAEINYRKRARKAA